MNANDATATFGDVIREHRQQRSLSLAGLARASAEHRPGGKPYSPQYLGKLEQGREQPSEEATRVLAAALDLDAAAAAELRRLAAAQCLERSGFADVADELTREAGHDAA